MNSLQTKLAASGLAGAIAISGAVLIAPHEGKVNEVYLDPANILTSCYGHTGKELKPSMKFTPTHQRGQVLPRYLSCFFVKSSGFFPKTHRS